MFAQTLTVMPSDTACTGEIKIRSLLNRLQDAAGLAVLDLEGAPGELMERGYAWILLKYDFDVVKRLPCMDEAFEVRTWHTAADGLRTLRVFEVDALPPGRSPAGGSPTGEPLVRAKTSWVLIDLAAQRPVRADRHLPEVFTAAARDNPPIDPDFRTLPKAGSGREAGAGAGEMLFPVRFHDLDANVHVNNAVYFEWVYEATPLNLLEYGIRSVSAEFRASAKFGDTIRVSVRELPADACSGVREFVYAIWSTADPEHAIPKNGEVQSKLKSKPEKPLARFYCAWEALQK